MMAFAELGLYNTTRAQHRHRRGHRPAGGADVHARPAHRPGPPRLLAAQGRGTSASAACWHAWAGKVVGAAARGAAGAGRSSWCRWPSTARAWRATSTCWATCPRTTRPGRGSTCWPTISAPGRCSRSTSWPSTRRVSTRPRVWRTSSELQTLLRAVPHVTTVRSFTGSLPDKKTLSVADQLATAGEGRARRHRPTAGRPLEQRPAPPSELQRRPPASPTSTATWSSSPRGTRRSRTTPATRRQLGALVELAKLASSLQSTADGAAAAPAAAQQAVAATPGPRRRARLTPADLRRPARRHPAPRPLPEEQRGPQGSARRLHLRGRHRRPPPGGARRRPVQPEAIDAAKAIRSTLAAAGFDAAWSRATPPCCSTSSSPPTAT